MSDIVKDLLFKASDKDGIGWTPTTVVHVPAGLLHRAADEIERLRATLEDIAYGNPLHNEDDLMRIARAALEEAPCSSS
jgi:hypothetical protein